jgi:drug/metabolite transporter (DMT)-like permease
LRTFGDAVGSIYALVAGVSFALWAEAMERVERRLCSRGERCLLLGLVFLASYAVIITIVYAKASGPPGLSNSDIVIVALNGIRVAVVYFLMNVAIRLAGPLLPSIILVSEVPITMIIDHLVLGTVLPGQLLVGALAIVLGTLSVLSDELSGQRTTALAVTRA